MFLLRSVKLQDHTAEKDLPTLFLKQLVSTVSLSFSAPISNISKGESEEMTTDIL